MKGFSSVSAGFTLIFQLFEATPAATGLKDVAECYSLITFHLDLTYSDGIKDALAVERLPCGAMPVVELCELPLLQRGVQNLAGQPHGAVARWLT